MIRWLLPSAAWSQSPVSKAHRGFGVVFILPGHIAFSIITDINGTLILIAIFSIYVLHIKIQFILVSVLHQKPAYDYYVVLSRQEGICWIS